MVSKWMVGFFPSSYPRTVPGIMPAKKILKCPLKEQTSISLYLSSIWPLPSCYFSNLLDHRVLPRFSRHGKVLLWLHTAEPKFLLEQMDWTITKSILEPGSSERRLTSYWHGRRETSWVKHKDRHLYLSEFWLWHAWSLAILLPGMVPSGSHPEPAQDRMVNG